MGAEDPEYEISMFCKNPTPKEEKLVQNPNPKKELKGGGRRRNPKP